MQPPVADFQGFVGRLQPQENGILSTTKGVLKMSLGERIQQLRKIRGLSQEQLADSLNVSRQAISKWETDQSTPEIENILALSRVFAVSTDEILGNSAVYGGEGPTVSSERMKKRQHGTAAAVRGWLHLVDMKIILFIFSILCFIAISVCIIVNYAIDHRITWAMYTVVSVSFGWLIFASSLFKKLAVSLCAATLLSIPFLYFIEKITPVSDWFFGLGLPIAVTGIVLVWTIYLLFRFFKVSLWYDLAISVFLCGVADILIINYIVNSYLSTKTTHLEYSISIFSYTLVTLLLGILGYIRSRKKAAEKNL